MDAREGTGDGLLVLAATPIGRTEDASGRLRDLIVTADVIAAEDTRRFRRLADDLGAVPGGRVVSYYDAVERQRLPELVGALREGATVALLTTNSVRCVVVAFTLVVRELSKPMPPAVTRML